jgi:Flp pilus assembly protein TadB
MIITDQILLKKEKEYKALEPKMKVLTFIKVLFQLCILLLLGVGFSTNVETFVVFFIFLVIPLLILLYMSSKALYHAKARYAELEEFLLKYLNR